MGITFKQRREQIRTGQFLDRPKIERKWNDYCALRDEVVKLTTEDATRFKSSQFFAVGMPPAKSTPKLQNAWLVKATRLCRKILKNNC